MPRRKIVIRREYLPDPKFNSDIITRFIGHLNKNGKKSTAERICYGALDIVGEKTQKNSLKVFKQALENTKPLLEVRSRRVGGSTYQVPVEVRPSRRITLAMRWMITYAKQRKGKGMQESLATEIIDAFNNTGASVKKKEDTHKMAEANKAFAHYRW
ncbi:MAG: 30S ribosomal protein S7 [Candidatus Firestonebacteria bacterium]|nr:30S ribosomal protein S7 [Candidatus Firestonebacteria bacterium]